MKITSLTNSPNLTKKQAETFLAKHPNNQEAAVVLTVATKASQEEAAQEAKYKQALSGSNLAAVQQTLNDLARIRPLSGDELTLKAKCDKAVPLVSAMNTVKAEHRHEKVIELAAAILEDFPDHYDSKKTIRESGLILQHTEKGVEILNNIFRKAGGTHQ
jgi:hypothetical protein